MSTRPARSVALAALLAGLVALTGCGALPVTAPTDGDAGPPDPERDVLGWEAGYWHNESIDVDQSDGLDGGEMEAFVSRAMARVEVIREREFEHAVPVDVISREEYRSGSGPAPPNGTGDLSAYAAWNNQVWEALFVVGEDRNVQAELAATRGSSVAGFYSPSSDQIKIVADGPPVVDNATLVHELTHALQDQYVGLGDSALRARTQDGSLAVQGLVEGEANYVETRYALRCGEEWDCVPSPDSGGGGGPVNLGLFVTIFQPYSDGPVWVHDRVRADGWAAINDAYDSPPASTEQVIHLTGDRPVEVSVPDTATGGWERFPEQGVDGADTAGEASIFAMFWYQSRPEVADAGVVDPSSLGAVDSVYDVYDYNATPSAGWDGDRIVPYRRDTARGTAYGYVWVTAWDSRADASQFRAAHRQVLAAHDAARRGPNTWVVPEGPYADTFRLVQNGSRVVVVNAPSVDGLDALRTDLPGDANATTETPATGTDADDDRGTTAGGLPGFTPALAVLAVLAALALGVLVARATAGVADGDAD